MNKNAIIILLAITLTFVLSSGPSTKDLFDQFVELKTALGAQKEDIAVVIAQVRNTVVQSTKALNSFKRILTTQCKTSSARFASSVNNIEGAIRESQVSLANWKKTSTKSRSCRKRANASITKGRNEYHGFENRLGKLLIEYKVVAVDGDKKLGVIKVLRDIISDELLKRSGSFVQLSKFQKKLSELKDLLVSNTDSIYGPVVGVLLDLATERGFSDQGVLRKILENLHLLRNNIKSFRAKQESALDSEVENLQKQLKITVRRIDDYEKMKAQCVSKGLDARHYIKFHVTEATHLAVERNRKIQERKLFNKICRFERKATSDDKSLLKGVNAIYHGLNRKILRLN